MEADTEAGAAASLRQAAKARTAKEARSHWNRCFTGRWPPRTRVELISNVLEMRKWKDRSRGWSTREGPEGY